MARAQATGIQTDAITRWLAGELRSPAEELALCYENGTLVSVRGTPVYATDAEHTAAVYATDDEEGTEV